MVTQEVDLALLPSALLTRCTGQPFAFALDGGTEQSWGCGHALLGFRPRATLRVAANGVAHVRDGSVQRWSGDPLTLLDRFRAVYATAPEPEPFTGGVIAALSYDLQWWVDGPRAQLHMPAVRCAGDESALPVLHAAYYDWLLSYSYAERRYRLASAQRSRAELQRLATEISRLAAVPYPRPRRRPPPAPRVLSNFTVDQYRTAVRRILDYIAAGDAYQVNLAQRLTLRSPAAPPRIFSALQRHPVPFAAYVDGGDFVLLSNSPECFLTMHDDLVATCPIKGTRRRAADRQQDGALTAELEGDPKERAEHVMIVDLERNDLGRVCRPGSIHVDEFARVHSFPSLHHMISKVSGRLRAGATLPDVLRALFPGGSITGAPKIRAMEIIDELEPVRRGFYTGAIGFIGDDGAATFNLAIRTAVATRGRLSYHAGGGIVADSDPDREYAETLLKSEPFLAALRGDTDE